MWRKQGKSGGGWVRVSRRLLSVLGSLSRLRVFHLISCIIWVIISQLSVLYFQLCHFCFVDYMPLTFNDPFPEYNRHFHKCVYIYNNGQNLPFLTSLYSPLRKNHPQSCPIKVGRIHAHHSCLLRPFLQTASSLQLFHKVLKCTLGFPFLWFTLLHVCFLSWHKVQYWFLGTWNFLVH